MCGGAVGYESDFSNESKHALRAYSNASALWSAWKVRWGKDDNGANEASRFEAFSVNLRYIAEENTKGYTYSLGLNQFSDLPNDEFRQTYASGLRGIAFGTSAHHVDNATLSAVSPKTSIDWAQLGYVTPVKNQGQCGSCWAFSTTGSIESAYAIATRQQPPQISEQQFVDCETGVLHKGCGGANGFLGFPTAYQWASGRNLCSEYSYTYQAVQGTCQEGYCQTAIPRGAITGWAIVPPLSTTMLANAVAMQPVSVSVDAGSPLVQSYTGGVISGSCGGRTDHAVLAVGYGNDGLDYWKIKNSWGASWGESGYFRIEKGKWNAAAGECGVLLTPAYPKVSFSSSIMV
jgi:hypothetical protein